MNSYIRDLIETIHKCDMTTTYKMSWCRSLVERSVISPNERIIYLKDMVTDDLGIIESVHIFQFKPRN